ncbi:tyrosine-type recombinase/integrase [Halalkalirubrum salinum]|uniref:tyrosine-type recombinase/integrase n=1 Tax=Halalkalirubrum salinum TaxID=2563889 RepID=UPI0010FB15A3|nr:tyrosine-type recombinase/integrase [Halalkalirubrum salinum]
MTTNTKENDTAEPQEYRDWCHDLSELQKIGEEILENWKDQHPKSPRDYPTVKWLDDNGYSHLRWVLSEKHSMGVPEFFILMTSAGRAKGFEWGFGDVATIERCRAYLDDQAECRNWQPSTKRSNRSRLNGFLSRFVNEYGDDAIISLANDPRVETEAYDTFKLVAKTLRAESKSDDSAHAYIRAAHRFFEWLERSGRIEYDPMRDIEDEFRWEWTSDPTSLSDGQVRRLWVVADTDEEKMLIIGYCVWGVRTSELAGIHRTQFNFNLTDPKIKFGERARKNGPGEVSLMFGLEPLANLLDRRSTRRPNWNGYLFPSDNENREFLCAKEMRDRFKELCRKAEITIDEEVPTPKQGRSFYYNILLEADIDLLQRAAELAEEQGASDPKSVRDHYLTSEQRRQYRRVFFRHRIRQVLPEDAYLESDTNIESDRTLGDFN